MKKAQELLSKGNNVAERTAQYMTIIERNLQRSIIDSLQDEIYKLEDAILANSEFHLETDVNAGKSAMSAATCQGRFANIIDFEYQLELKRREMKFKKAAFDKYFKEKGGK